MMNMALRWGVRGIAIAVLLAVTFSPVFGGEGSASRASSAEALRAAMRVLWEDHVVWTRLYIVSVAAGLPDRDATAARLLRNQADIGAAIKPYYGQAAGDALTRLLREHILTAAQLLDAVKSGDEPAAASAKQRWYANADQIAAFLARANPQSWPQAEMRAMMRDHLDLTLTEAAARLKGDWTADIAAYERVRAQILRMADMLSRGIIRQFPGRFR